MNEPIFEIRFSSELFRIRKVIKDVFSFINEHLPNLSPEDVTDLRLIFSELLSNAIIHGNNSDSCKNVRLFIRISGNTIYSTISDEGRGFDYNKQITEASRRGENLTMESGRGILLVSYLADSIAYNVSGNRIDFYKKVAL
ncbi:MAG: ATP-binding protein [Clostridiales bacterium]|jgi:serine/threonine-protein kinase RsbW|nr:ATP-binding protein [Clostridiales bacterium]